MEKIEVKSNDIIIGHTYDEGKTIEFLKNPEALKVKDKLFTGQPIGISSRKMGTIGEDGKVILSDLNELWVVNIDKTEN